MRWRTESESEKNTIFPSFLVYLVSQQALELPQKSPNATKSKRKKNHQTVFMFMINHSYRVSVVKAFNLKL